MEANFKLRYYVKGKAVYLKPDQQLQDMPPGSMLNVFYADSADAQRKRRLQASLTASLVRADVQEEARQTRTHTKLEADRIILTVEQASKPADEYFSAIGGAGDRA